MTLKKQIKTFLTLFVVLLLAFTVTAALLFRKNFEHFHVYISDRSQSHLNLLQNLSEIESNLYVYQKSFQCALSSGDDKCLISLNESRQAVRENDAELETFNKAEFPSWISVADFNEADPTQLRGILKSFKEARKVQARNDSDFQRLYYLTRENINIYFQDTSRRLQDSLGGVPPAAFTESDVSQQALELIYLGVNEIREYYNTIFWDDAKKQNRVFTTNTENYYYAMITVSILLVVFALMIAMLISMHFKKQQQRDENLIVLGTRDMATGLFNRRSLEALLGQEIQRAKRRHYPLSILMVRIEPYEEIKKELGPLALDRLFFQVSETLKTSCRNYDSLFKFDKNSFIIVFPEADPKVLNLIAARFEKKLSKKRFLVRSDQTKVTPQILIGAAGYPVSGGEYTELLAFAEATLSERFDARVIQQNTDGVVSTPQVIATAAEEIEAAVVSDLPVAETAAAAPEKTPEEDPDEKVSDVVAALTQDDDVRGAS